MRNVLLAACLMATALPACRTVRTVELAPSLEAAVAQTHGRGVRIERFDASPLRNATALRVSPLMLSYVPDNGFARDSLPREQVEALTVHVGGLQTGLASIGLVSAGLVAAAVYQLQCSWVRTCPLSYPILASGVVLNALVNPYRERVVYHTPAR